MGVLIRFAYALRRLVWRWPTRGVRVLVEDREGRILLVRHRYGRRDLWMMPGGGIARGETPEAAARREVAEETGCRITALDLVGVFVSRAEGRRDTVSMFRGRSDDAPFPDAIEIAEVAFFPREALPDAISPATLRRLAELDGRRQGDGRW